MRVASFLRIILSCGAYCLWSAEAKPMEETVYMRKSKIEDQDSAATGYSYQIYSGAQPQLFGYPPITVGRYTNELPAVQLPLEEANLAGHQLPLNSYGLPAQPIPLPPPLGEIHQGGAEESSDFAKGGGQSYGSSSGSSNGAADSSGYKSEEGFAKGAKGHHENSQTKGYQGQEGGNNAAHHQSGQHFDKKEEAATGTKGGSFRQKSSRKKGSKTTGYHRVHHKDEYKKDHTFYDDSDSSGHFRKYGDFDAKQAAEKGAFEKGGRQDSAYNAGRQGQQGFLDKGRYVDQESAFRGAGGKEAHHKDASQYAKNAGREQDRQQGFSQSQGGKIYQTYP